MDFTVRLVDALTAPARLASAAVSGLDKGMTMAGKASDYLSDKVVKAGKAISDLAKKATAPIANALNPVIEKAKALGNQIAAPYKAAAEKATAFGNRVKDAVTNSKVYQLGEAGVKKIGGALSSVGSVAASVGSRIGSTLGNGLKSVGAGASSLVSKLGGLASMGAAGLALGAVVAAGALAKMAIGEKGMAKLSAVGDKFTQNLTQMFKGINIEPLINGLMRMVNLFSGSTNSGKALGRILNGAFNGLFSLMDKFSKISEVAFLYILRGFLKLENAFLKLKIWSLPIVWAIQDAWKELQPKIDIIKESFGKLWTAIKDIGSSFDVTKGNAESIGKVLAEVLKAAIDKVIIIMGTLIDIVKSVGKIIKGVVDIVVGVFTGDWAKAWSGAKTLVRGAVEGIIDLFFGAVEVITGGIDLIAKSFGKDLKLTEKVDGWRKDIKKGLGDMLDKNAEQTDKGGKETGKALGDGMIKGLDDKESDIYKAGEKAAKAALAGAKDAAEVKSPSRKMAYLGRMYGQGVIVGMESQEQAINRAAQESLVPSMNDVMTSSPAFSSKGKSSGSSTPMQVIFQPGSITGSNAEEIADKVVRKIMDNYADEVAVSTGSN